MTYYLFHMTRCYKLMMHLYSLSASMQDRVLGKLNNAHVGAINRNRVDELDM